MTVVVSRLPVNVLSVICRTVRAEFQLSNVNMSVRSMHLQIETHKVNKYAKSTCLNETQCRYVKSTACLKVKVHKIDLQTSNGKKLKSTDKTKSNNATKADDILSA